MKIFLAEANQNIRDGLRALCEQVDGADIIGDATNMDELLNSLKHCCPDVLLIRQVYPGLSLDDFDKTIWQVCPDLTIFVLSVSVSEGIHHQAANSKSRIIPVEKPEQLLDLLLKFSKQENTMSVSGMPPTWDQPIDCPTSK